MPRVPVSATIITLNEEHNLERALNSLKWVDEVIVVDSGSQDRTRQIAVKHGAKFFKKSWHGYGKQKNVAQNLAKNKWVLNLDADEEVPSELAEWIQLQLSSEATGQKKIRGFSFPRKTFYLGKWIKHGGWYPNHVVRLSHRQYSKWSEPEIHENLEIQGQIIQSNLPLHHYTFRGIEDQIRTNILYSKKGYLELKKHHHQASLLKLVIKPIGKFIETYILKKGFLDGIPGFIISINAAHSVFLKYSYFYEERLKK